jgi:Ca2+-binding EF-hand superfamily protein
MKSSYLATAVLAAVCLTHVGCQTTEPDRFDQADTNRDRKLSRDEINTYSVTNVFKSRDRDGDGRMTMAEWMAQDDRGQQAIFRNRDTNRDGVVTLEEALAYGQKKGAANELLREADQDKDGLVSRTEMTAYYASKEGPPQ